MATYSALSEAVTDVRQILNESTASFWTDTEIQDWIKQGVVDLCTKGSLYQLDAEVDPLVAGQLSYTSSDETWIGDASEIHACFYVDDSGSTDLYYPMMKITPKQLGNLANNTAGQPRYYFLFGGELYIWPLATATEVSNGKLFVMYSKIDDDITNLPEEYQHLPVDYAAARGKMKDQKYSEAQLLLQFYLNGINFEREDKVDRGADDYSQFHPPRSKGRR